MSNCRDTRGGAYDPITKCGNPQPPQVKEKDERHSGAPMCDPSRCLDQTRAYPLPEGLRKPRMGPLNKDTGRRPKVS
jgi:hypothetical protein